MPLWRFATIKVSHTFLFSFWEAASKSQFLNGFLIFNSSRLKNTLQGFQNSNLSIFSHHYSDHQQVLDMINRDRTLDMDFVLGCRQFALLETYYLTWLLTLFSDVFLQKSFPRSISFYPAYDCPDSAEIKCECGTSIYFHQRLNRTTVRPPSQLASEGFYGLDEVVASDCWHHFVTLFSSFKFRHSSEFVTTSHVHIALSESLAAQSSSETYPNFQYSGMVWHRHKSSVPSGFRIERESFSDCSPNYLRFCLLVGNFWLSL